MHKRKQGRTQTEPRDKLGVVQREIQWPNGAWRETRLSTRDDKYGARQEGAGLVNIGGNSFYIYFGFY